jgi:hypothetical protein
MTARQIIEVLNKHIFDIRSNNKVSNNSFFKLKPELITNGSFGIHKTFKYSVILVSKNLLTIEALTTELTMPVVKDKEPSAWEELDRKLLLNILKWIGTDSFDKVVYGEIA